MTTLFHSLNDNWLKNLKKVSNALFDRITEDNWEKHEEAVVNYADLKSSHAPSTEASETDSSCDDILKIYDNTLPLTKRQLVKVS
ncbi:hypothetical protein Tco_0938418 [Tanacetum coccineum]|uniref:Uncharacterized protein n=1 Tax=Tanacetum coccineum TaxID=301880 RepID=A0ABQ5DIZ7_9ASTR